MCIGEDKSKCVQSQCEIPSKRAAKDCRDGYVSVDVTDDGETYTCCERVATGNELFHGTRVLHSSLKCLCVVRESSEAWSLSARDCCQDYSVFRIFFAESKARCIGSMSTGCFAARLNGGNFFVEISERRDGHPEYILTEAGTHAQCALLICPELNASLACPPDQNEGQFLGKNHRAWVGLHTQGQFWDQ